MKRIIVQYLRTALIPTKELYPILFAIVIFLLVVLVDEKTSIIIDEEYTGKNKIIKETLEKLLTKHFGEKWQGTIRFSRIGRQSPAHKLAWKIHRSKRKVGIKRVTKEEILRLLA